ncbi:hypothetical protein GOP47_0014186 [Adiantum capillus-veneris]|uniref:Uncharacterized protein n=1 Tax=Adiantum capillus-veneris TaxID=13818 RepID=A0A9D4ZG49_ADICA|nr:hypothetical protein GOP47_0014186 [Adiantum capillus-veneris]
MRDRERSISSLKPKSQEPEHTEYGQPLHLSSSHLSSKTSPSVLGLWPSFRWRSPPLLTARSHPNLLVLLLSCTLKHATLFFRLELAHTCHNQLQLMVNNPLSSCSSTPNNLCS